MTIDKPQPDECPEYIGNYVSKATWTDLLEAHRESLKSVQLLLKNLPEEKWNYRYAEGKWSIRDIVGHLIDSERIMVFRALSIARKEPAGLPGFEEADYARNSNASERSSDDLLDELQKVRESTISFFKSLKEESFLNVGIANNYRVSVRALAWMIPGHTMHHVGVIKERYLSA